MVIGTPAENETRVFFDMFYDLGNRDVRMALEDHLIWAVDTGTPERAKTAQPLAERLGITWPHKEKLTLAVVDMEGKLLAQSSLDAFLVDGKVDRAKLIALLDEYRQELPDAQKLLDDAFAEAKRDNKRVFVQESGPYCAPCVLLSRFIEKHRELFDKDYVYVKLDRRFAHGKEVLEGLRETGHGIPWSVILDAEGNPLINSNGEEGNIGFPSAKAEIAHFKKMLQTTKRNITPDELQSLIDDLGNQ